MVRKGKLKGNEGYLFLTEKVRRVQEGKRLRERRSRTGKNLQKKWRREGKGCAKKTEVGATK